MDTADVILLIVAVVGVVIGVHASCGLTHHAHHWRGQRQLDRASRTEPARVVAVEPMQRELNNAAGHPVALEFQDAAGARRRVRDTSGLGGYLARAGTRVTIRYSAADPGLVQAEAIEGPRGAYPIHPRGRLGRGALPGLLAALALGILLAVAGLALAVAGGDALQERFVAWAGRWLLPGFLALLGATLLVAPAVGAATRARRERHRPRDEVVGVVSEVWRERVNTGSTVYPFTVYFVTADGREVHTRSPGATARFRPRVNQRVRVRHDREHPVWFEVRELRRGSTTGTLLVVFAGILLLAVGAVWLAVQRSAQV